jgi:trehalose 6-phosphate synthase
VLQLRVADDFASSIAAYKQFDVLLVNAVSDGLNLVAKEAPLLNTRDGVVVLSVNTGAWEELGSWTIGVDPFDVEAQADALERALELPPDERRARRSAIAAQVREHDLGAWVEAQLGDLDRAISMRE